MYIYIYANFTEFIQQSCIYLGKYILSCSDLQFTYKRMHLADEASPKPISRRDKQAYYI